MKKVTIALALVLVLGLLAGCGSDASAVYVQSVADITGYGALGEYNTCAGVVVAGNEVKIEKDENRKIVELKVEVGQNVKEGDVLFVYDTDEIKLSLDKAQLEIEQLKNSLTDYDNQIAQLQKEKANAGSSEQLGYTVQIQALQADKREAEYNITVKERELESLKSTDMSGEVKATINGEVKSINENGGTDNMTGQPLPYMTLVESGAYRVKGKINELNRDQFSIGQTVTLRSRADTTQTWTGVIDSVDTNPEENNNNNYYYDGGSDEYTSSSSYPFYITLDSSDGLVLGQHLYIEPEQATDGADSGIWLDGSYVVENEDGTYSVWAADSRDKLEKRTVTVSETDDMFYRYLITEGLSLDDRIAIPAENLQEGTPVTDEMPEPSVDNGGIDDSMTDNGGIDDGMIGGGMDGVVGGDYADGGIDTGLIEGGLSGDDVGVIDSIPEENTEGAETQPVEGEG